MVLLTITECLLEALERSTVDAPAAATSEGVTDSSNQPQPAQPPLPEPALGKPISHGQIVELWKKRKESGNDAPTLEGLLRGTRVYVPPPPPKPEPSKEYVALMERLRREEEQRAYERMLNPAPKHETFHDHFPNRARSYAEANRPVNQEDMGDDDVTYNDVHRQVMLLINFLVSIAGVAATLWIAARWWSTPARLFLTMGGSIVVAIAEVAVYQIYVWRMGEAKAGQKAVKEVRELVKTWVIQDGEAKEVEQQEKVDPVLIEEKDDGSGEGVRRRKPPLQAETITPDL